MNDFLKKIIAERRLDIGRAKKEFSLNTLQGQLKSRGETRSLLARLQAKPDGRHAGIIAEIKRASPSEGILRADLDPADLAREYENAGAMAISILTEPKYFLGLDKDMREVRKVVKTPVLRKDFTVDPWQVYQSAVLGADVVLLIVAALELHLLQELYHAANDAHLETIIEVHTLPELETVLQFPKAIIGINNRNLATLKTDISTAVNLAPHIPEGRAAIAESGIKSRREVEMLMKLGYRGFLIGTSLVKAKSPAAILAKLIGTT